MKTQTSQHEKSNLNLQSISDDSFEKRFWSKVEITEDCWYWKASLRNGYGNLRINNRTYYAHRVAYELLIGEIPDGKIS